jgi:hypothetical protein
LRSFLLASLSLLQEVVGAIKTERHNHVSKLRELVVSGLNSGRVGSWEDVERSVAAAWDREDFEGYERLVEVTEARKTSLLAKWNARAAATAAAAAGSSRSRLISDGSGTKLTSTHRSSASSSRFGEESSDDIASGGSGGGGRKARQRLQRGRGRDDEDGDDDDSGGAAAKPTLAASGSSGTLRLGTRPELPPNGGARAAMLSQKQQSTSPGGGGGGGAMGGSMGGGAGGAGLPSPAKQHRRDAPLFFPRTPNAPRAPLTPATVDQARAENLCHLIVDLCVETALVTAVELSALTREADHRKALAREQADHESRRAAAEAALQALEAGSRETEARLAHLLRQPVQTGIVAALAASEGVHIDDPDTPFAREVRECVTEFGKTMTALDTVKEALEALAVLEAPRRKAAQILASK